MDKLQIALELFLPFLGYGFSILMAEASKYILNKTFNWKIFWKTNIKPLRYNLIAAVVIVLVSVFTPQFSIFIEQSVGGEVNVDSGAKLFASAALFAVVIKSITGKPTEAVKKEIQFQDYIKRNNT